MNAPSHPLLTRLQRSKLLTIGAICGYALIPLSIALYGLYTWSAPKSHITYAGDLKGYPEMPGDTLDTPFVAPSPKKPTPPPVIKPPSKTPKKHHGNRIQLASNQTKEKKKEPEHRQENYIQPPASNADIPGQEQSDPPIADLPSEDPAQENTEEPPQIETLVL